MGYQWKTLDFYHSKLLGRHRPRQVDPFEIHIHTRTYQAIHNESILRHMPLAVKYVRYNIKYRKYRHHIIGLIHLKYVVRHLQLAANYFRGIVRSWKYLNYMFGLIHFKCAVRNLQLVAKDVN